MWPLLDKAVSPVAEYSIYRFGPFWKVPPVPVPRFSALLPLGLEPIWPATVSLRDLWARGLLSSQPPAGAGLTFESSNQWIRFLRRTIHLKAKGCSRIQHAARADERRPAIIRPLFAYEDASCPFVLLPRSEGDHICSPPGHQELLIFARGHLAESDLHLLAPGAGLEKLARGDNDFKLPFTTKKKGSELQERERAGVCVGAGNRQFGPDCGDVESSAPEDGLPQDPSASSKLGHSDEA
ncbi:unnamed protein product [Pleuronectes platessa]|uniref:Uncharacterized protein n=1 Tax=Pleuronectes platessa TaxID=8262 RepID=A0A9N7UY94_PLEPL|nr:unnamed protein product [Pleuronectes platessa]